MKRFFPYLHKPEAIFFQFSVFMTLHCLGAVVNADGTVSPAEEPNFIWFPNADGSGVVKANLQKDKSLSPGRHHEVDENQIKFFLYTRTQYTPQEIPKNNIQLNNTNFNFNHRVIIVIHGFDGSHLGGFSSYIKDAYLNYVNRNVIGVDWSPLSAAPWYFEAAQHAKFVGRVVGEFILQLQAVGVPSAGIHVIGHSLGAHVAGFVGAELSGKLKRVTGLDPAAPLFEHLGTSGRLDPSDAYFVDVIHTAGGILGLTIPSGHADFYPNGGARQPGCGLDILGICSHSRSYQYYGESIRDPTGFISCLLCGLFNLERCDCYHKMGVDCDPSTRGHFHLRTYGSPPFAKG